MRGADTELAGAWCPARRPLVPAGMTHWRGTELAVTVATTTCTPAMPPLVIQSLVPLIVQVSFSLLYIALVRCR